MGRRPMTHVPWSVGHLLLAGVLGLSIGWSAVPAWLPSLGVLTAVLLGIVRPTDRAVWATALVVLLVTATAAGAATGERRLEFAALAASAALAHAAAIALPLGLVELARRRRRHRDQGWELARSLAREDNARTESALMRERAAMAGEIHDNLGHRLTLVSVQLGQLSLDPDLPPRSRTAVEEARLGAAEAAAELGETVQLLKAGGDPSRSPTDRALSDIARAARSAGLVVDGDLPEGLDRALSSHAHAALARVLSEGFANAAKHAPDETVRIDGRIDDGRAVLTVANARGRVANGGAPSSGHGLPSLHHRLALLGGMLEVEHDEEHTIRATVPVDAIPGGDAETADTLAQVMRSRQTADERARSMRRLTWAVPAGLAAGAVLITVAFFLYLTVSSTLPREEFSRVEVGMTQAEAEELLPPVEMIEAPRDALPEPEGASCRYHEEAVSLFVREDVFRICIAGGIVVSTDTIPASGGAP